MMLADMIRINRVHNGFVISSRRDGTVPQTYSYTDRAVATTVDEVCRQIHALLTPLPEAPPSRSTEDVHGL